MKDEFKVLFHGNEISLSEEELMAIVYDYFERKEVERLVFQVSEKPEEDKWFAVYPLQINRELFTAKREDPEQEHARMKILKAFRELDKNPERYAHKFKTMFPRRTWDKNHGKEIKELSNMAKTIGGHMANEFEQYLEWAQRIQNGESWKSLCNEPDVATSYRVVECKENPYLCKVIGGATDTKSKLSPTHVLGDRYAYYEKIGCSVPLVISYNVP